jgi:hypothetical protein
MYLIQILLVLFFVFALVKVVIRYRKGEVSERGLGFWVSFWLLSAAVVLRPNSTAYFAKIVGIGRGADLVVYCSVALLFFIIFRLMITVNRLERQITVLTREIALKENQPD